MTKDTTTSPTSSQTGSETRNIKDARAYYKINGSNSINIQTVIHYEKAIEYVKKDGCFKEFGKTPIIPKTRDELALEIVTKVIEGTTIDYKELVLENPKLLFGFRNLVLDIAMFKVKT